MPDVVRFTHDNTSRGEIKNPRISEVMKQLQMFLSQIWLFLVLGHLFHTEFSKVV